VTGGIIEALRNGVDVVVFCLYSNDVVSIVAVQAYFGLRMMVVPPFLSSSRLCTPPLLT